MSQGFPVILLDLIIDLLAMHRDIDGRFNADFNEVAIEAHDFDCDAAINYDTFAGLAGEDEHRHVGNENI
jgi:hypothetical protein